MTDFQPAPKVLNDETSKFIPVLCSHKTVEWSTPQEFYDKLNEKYHFTLDVASTHENAKCERHYTIEDDGLKQPWDGVIWCNPPYGLRVIDWVKKAIECKNKVVMLLPVRTSTKCFHEYIIPNAKIYFVRRKITFGGWKSQAPFDSMLCEFN
jgi:site-specific DNA-methyltransferase (adenine-specific)